MSATTDSASRLGAADPRPLVVTVVVVGYLLICGLGGLNALVVLVNGSTRVALVESPSQDHPFKSIEPGDEYSEFLPEPRKPELVELERIFSAAFVAIAICGSVGAIGLFRRKRWSRALLWAITTAAILGPAVYDLRVLQIQSFEIIDVVQRQEAFRLVAPVSLINVAIQSIPLVVLAGLLRHSACRSYVFGAPAEDSPTR